MASTKISPEFEKRLAAQPPEGTVYAVLLVAVPKTLDLARNKAARRRDTLETIRAAAELAMPEIDQVLARFGGRRLADRVDALGSLPVETTPAGIRALAASEGVKAILEDQPVSRLN